MSTDTILIKNARIIDPSQGLDQLGNVFVADGNIVAIGSVDDTQGPDNFTTSIVIDGTDQILCPGFIDLNTRLPEPGFEQKGTIASETRAAAASGFTQLVCVPNTQPVIDSPAIASLVKDKAKEAGFCYVNPLGAMTQQLEGKQLSEMHALSEAGCVAVSDGRQTVQSIVLQRALEYAKSHNLTVFLNPVDEALKDGGCVHESFIATRLGLRTIPSAAETIALSRDLMLAKRTGVKVHFPTISCAESVTLIADAQKQGLPVTAGVSIQHLHLTETSIEGFNAQCHVLPPFRSEEDLVALRQGVADGVISVICSDHSPHEAAAKLAPFAVTEPGISAFDSFLPLALFLVDNDLLSLEQLITALTHGPAQVIDQPLRQLKAGAQADLCLFSPTQEWQLTPETMLSMGHNTPFAGQTLKGKVTATVFNGKISYQQ